MKKLKQIILAILIAALIISISVQVGMRLGKRDAPAPSCDCLEFSAIKNRLEFAESRLSDWPQICFYAASNRELSSAPASQGRVVFIGNSITYSWGQEGFGGFLPGKPYINRGIGAQTPQQMLVASART
jgi:hypothetical protein